MAFTPFADFPHDTLNSVGASGLVCRAVDPIGIAALARGAHPLKDGQKLRLSLQQLGEIVRERDSFFTFHSIISTHAAA